MIDLLQSYLSVAAYGDAVELVAAMPAVIRRTSQIREKHAFALNRLGRRGEGRRHPEAIDRRARPGQRDLRPARPGLQGPVGRGGPGRPKPARRRACSDKAIEAYLTGFAADWRDHYPGINAVQLMHLRDPADTRIAEVLPVVRYSARQKALRHHADFWDHATLLELRRDRRERRRRVDRRHPRHLRPPGALAGPQHVGHTASVAPYPRAGR